MMPTDYSPLVFPPGVDSRLIHKPDLRYTDLAQSGGNGRIWYLPDKSMEELSQMHKRLAIVYQASFDMRDFGFDEVGSHLGMNFQDNRGNRIFWRFHDRGQIADFLGHCTIYRPSGTLEGLTDQFSGLVVGLLYSGSGVAFDTPICAVGLIEHPAKYVADEKQLDHVSLYGPLT